MPSDKSDKSKGNAKGLLYNFLEFLDKKESNNTPPKTPPRTDNPIPNFNKLSTSPKTDDPIPKFKNLSISPNQGIPLQAPNGFVGGFHTRYDASTSHTPNPTVGTGPSRQSFSTPTRPMAMPMPTLFSDQPQSVTMQMVLRPSNAGFIPQRPHSNPLPPAAIRPSISSSSSTPSKPSKKKPVSSPSTPAKGNNGESQSAPLTPNAKTGQVQCAGVTKAGRRCNRIFNSKVAFWEFESENGDYSSSIPEFCHQHRNELMKPTGYYARNNHEWVEFEAWIPGYLQIETQVSLRVEMEKARSQADVEGYIYTFEIRELKETESIKLKVGRTVNLVKRIDQWGKQCGSKEQVLRGFYPGTVEPDEDGNEGSLMKGRVKAGDKGPWCHRLERLIHLELADLASTNVYLNPSWPNIDPPPSAKTAPSSSKASSRCPDCGSMHKEIFEFKRWKQGKYYGKEWDQLVKPVIDRWGRFVELYV